MWHTFFYQPLLNALIFFYQFLGHNLGLAIIGLTLLIRGILTPLTLPSLKSASKIKEIQPELEALKKQYGKDKQEFAKKQLELYKKHDINPAAGCLPQIIQIIVLIALYQAFNQVLQSNGDFVLNLNQVLYPSLKLAPDFLLNSKFLYLDLTKPDIFTINNIKLPGLFLIAAALTQFLSSKMMMPSAKAGLIKAEKTPEKSDDMAATMQKQMLYMMPLMTLFIGLKFPSGLVIYWLTFSIFMLTQQLLMKKKRS